MEQPQILYIVILKNKKLLLADYCESGFNPQVIYQITDALKKDSTLTIKRNNKYNILIL